MTTEAEDQPGYDGPSYDPYSRLQVFMDSSVPAADRDRLINEYRDHVLTEGASLLRAQHTTIFDAAGGGVAAGLLISADLLLAARAHQEG